VTDLSKEYLSAHTEFSKSLRTWFVAYGIGAPVLLLTNKEIANTLKESGNARAIAAIFLVGVCLQVMLATANKTSMWGIYYGETNPLFKNTRRYKSAWWFSEAYWIDLVIDVTTMGAFGAATFWAFSVILV